MPSNSTARGTLNEQGTHNRKSHSRPPLFVSDEMGAEHDAMYAKDGNGATEEAKRVGIPQIFKLIVPIAVCVGIAIVASVYHIQWLLMTACVLAALSVIVYFISARRRDRYQALSDKETMDRQVAEYKRDLIKTLEGYDVDRGMSEAEIDAFVDEYRHHLEVENASLANASLIGTLMALLRRNKGKDGANDEGGRTGRRSRRKPGKQKADRRGLSDGE